MQHLSAEVPGLLEPLFVRTELSQSRAQVEHLESHSLTVFTADRARTLRADAAALHERLVRLARAGYAPLRSMPVGSYVAPEFDELGTEVSDLLARLRRIIDHCQQVESTVVLREQADAEREHRRRFPQELALLEGQREILAALYPDRWLVLYDGAIRGDYSSIHEALQAGEDAKGRDDFGRPLFLVFCHRTQRPH